MNKTFVNLVDGQRFEVWSASKSRIDFEITDDTKEEVLQFIYDNLTPENLDGAKIEYQATEEDGAEVDENNPLIITYSTIRKKCIREVKEVGIVYDVLLKNYDISE